MKELSIEEKAHRYDEALKEAVVAHKDEDKHLKATLERIFPELKESEDEKIRQALLVEYSMDGHLTDAITHKKIRLWLEKQGKKDEEILVLKDQIESLHAAIKAVKEIHKIELKKQGEQKPILDVEIPFGAKDSDLEEVSYNIPNGYHAEIEDNKVVIKKGEHKPAWSEEDNTVLNNLIYALANDRISNSRDEYVNWLKSLKQRYTWKPSDEQMKALENAISMGARLDSLYNDLKKLREE